MRRVHFFLIAVFVVLVAGVIGHYRLREAAATRQAQAQVQTPNADAPGDVVVAIGPPPPSVKTFRQDPDPAEGASDRASCQKAGGVWSGSYKRGRCGSKRQPVPLADAGKACRGQADCIGNCTTEELGGGQWSAPKCQAFQQTDYCGGIYDKGWHFAYSRCPIP